MGRAQSAPLRAWNSRYIASTAEHSNKWGSPSRPTLTQIMNFKNRGLTFLNCIKLANLLTLKLNNCLCVARDPRPEEIDLATRTSFLPYAATSAEWAGEQKKRRRCENYLQVENVQENFLCFFLQISRRCGFGSRHELSSEQWYI